MSRTIDTDYPAIHLRGRKVHGRFDQGTFICHVVEADEYYDERRTLHIPEKCLA